MQDPFTFEDPFAFNDMLVRLSVFAGLFVVFAVVELLLPGENWLPRKGDDG